MGSNYDPKERNISDRWQTLEKTGAHLAFGSDWPCIWPPNPFIAIQEAVTRQVWRPVSGSEFPGGVFDGAGQAGYIATKDVYAPEERLTVEQAVRAYTLGSAYARFSDDKLGTLEVGKEADLAVLSQDIFSVNPEEISKTKVMTTIVAGKIVYEGGR